MPEGDLIAIRMRLTGGKQVAAESQAAAKGIQATGAAAKSASTSQAAANARLAKTATTLRTTGRALTRYVTLPIIAVTAAAGVMALDFDRGMRNVNSIAQLPERSFNTLKQQVLDLAGPTAQAPKTLAEGLYDLVSSGFDASESMTILEKSALAASAGLTTTDVSTKAVAAVLNAYELPAKRAGFVSDVLFRTVDRGVITFEELASNIGKVIPFAASSGISLSEMGAGVATLTKQGQSGAEAITFLKNTIVAFNKPSADLTDAIKKSGYESGEALLKARGFQGALEAVTATTDGSRAAVTKLFPNIRAQAAVFGLTGKKARAAAADLRGFDDASGATSRALKEQEKSFGFQLQRSWAELSVVLIEIGEQLLPVVVPMLLGMADAARTAVDAFAGLPAPLQHTVIGLVGLAALAGPMLLLAGAIARAVLAIRALRAAEATGAGVGLLGGGRKAMLGRLGVGVAGTAASQIGGNAIGGDVGNAVGNVGTGAAAGFMVGGPMGAAVGATGGAVLSAVQKLKASFGQLNTQQQRLVDSATEVRSAWAKQRDASRGLAAANDRVGKSQRRTRGAARAMNQAQRHLNAVIEEYGAKSRPAIHAEARLVGLTRKHRVALKQLQNAERLRGVELSAYKTLTNTAVLAERHRINVLANLRDRQMRLFQVAKQANPQSERTRELATKLVTTQSKLGEATKKHSQTLSDAAAKGGQRYAKFLQNASQESLRFGGQMRMLSERARGFEDTVRNLNNLQLNLPTIPGGRSAIPRNRKPDGNAAGTNWWRGGLSLVGERGIELVDLPRGSRVIPAPRTRQLLGDPQAAQVARSGREGKTRYLVATPVKIGRKVVAEAVVEAQEDSEARL